MEKYFSKVALAITMSPTAQAILTEAVRIKKIFGAELVLIHIGKQTGVVESFIDEQLAKCELSKESVKVVWEEGDPADKIRKVCRQEQVDLLIMGALKREKLIGQYIGTIARKIMRKASCSVMVISNPTTKPQSFETLVVNGEDSPNLQRTLGLACSIAAKDNSRWVHIVRELKMYGLTLSATHQYTSDEYDRVKGNLVRVEIDTVTSMLASIPHDPKGINVKVVAGKSGFELKEFAKRKNAQLLIVGAPTRRFFWLDRIFPHDLEYVFGDLPCNLLIVYS